MDKKIITIIIATFNASNSIRKCIESIIPQKNESVELLVIDGKSSDNTSSIIESYGGLIDSFICEPDAGVYDAWNKGINACNGEWIMFLGADDTLLPHAINSLLMVIKHEKYIKSFDYICAKIEYVNKSGHLIKIIGMPPNWSRMRKRMSAAHVASLHSKSNLYDACGLYNLNFKICGDYELLLRKKNSLKYIFLDKCIARMQIGGMSFSTDALIEAYLIRSHHNSVTNIYNIFLLLKNYIIFYLFNIRNRVKWWLKFT